MAMRWVLFGLSLVAFLGAGYLYQFKRTSFSSYSQKQLQMLELEASAMSAIRGPGRDDAFFSRSLLEEEHRRRYALWGLVGLAPLLTLLAFLAPKAARAPSEEDQRLLTYLADNKDPKP